MGHKTCDIWGFVVPKGTAFEDKMRGCELGNNRRTNGICDFWQENFAMEDIQRKMMKEIIKNTEIQVAIITVVGVLLTIIGSIVATNLTNNSQLEQQRVDAIREMKRTYYNQLTEAYTEKLMYINKPESVEKVEAEMRFVKEASRVPLYASQEMVEFMENIKDPEIAKNASTAEYYRIMRKDLASCDFKNFDNLIEISIPIPNKVVVTDENGDKQIQ